MRVGDSFNVLIPTLPPRGARRRYLQAISLGQADDENAREFILASPQVCEVLSSRDRLVSFAGEVRTIWVQDLIDFLIDQPIHSGDLNAFNFLLVNWTHQARENPTVVPNCLKVSS